MDALPGSKSVLLPEVLRVFGGRGEGSKPLSSSSGASPDPRLGFFPGGRRSSKARPLFIRPPTPVNLRAHHQLARLRDTCALYSVREFHDLFFKNGLTACGRCPEEPRLTPICKRLKACQLASCLLKKKTRPMLKATFPRYCAARARYSGRARELPTMMVPRCITKSVRFRGSFRP